MTFVTTTWKDGKERKVTYDQYFDSYVEMLATEETPRDPSKVSPGLYRRVVRHCFWLKC